MNLHLTIKKAVRHLLRSKSNSLLNVLGLTTGFICVFCISSYVLHEYSFDQTHPDKENTYRIISNDVNPGNKDKTQSSITFLPIRKFIMGEVPEVLDVVRVKKILQSVITTNNDVFIEKGFMWADSSVLNLFDIKLIEGNKQTALSAPNSLIIGLSDAKKYFGTQNVMHQQLTINDEKMTITGVFEDIASTNHLQFGMIGSMQTVKNPDDPWSQQGHIYLRLADKADVTAATTKINEVLKDKTWWISAPLMLSLQNIQKVHLYSSDITASPNAVDITYLYLFCLIGFIIVLSTTFNCISLSIADIYNRKQNIGISKILGSSKFESIMQPVIECTILCFLSAILAITFSAIFIDTINMVMESDLSVSFLISAQNISLIVALTICVILISSIYPAILISGFNPLKLLNKQIAAGKVKLLFRKPLLVIQSAIVVVLLMVVVVVSRQMKHLSNDHLGFNKEQILVLKSPRFGKVNASLMKQQISALNEVEGVTLSLGSPLSGGLSYLIDNVENPYYMSEFTVDEDYVKTLGMKILSGRDFNLADSNSVIINEAMAKVKNWEEPIGQKVYFFGKERTVVGVVEDFQMNNIKSVINPAVLGLENKFRNSMLLKMNPLNIEAGLENIKKIWSQVSPEAPLSYDFLDKDFETLFKSEIKFQRLSKIFTGIAIVITCLGLYGAILYAAQQRVKEIGIRKVLGASGSKIVSLLIKEYVSVLAFGVIIAIPVSWWLLNKWLNNFAYKIPIEWWMFAFAAFVTLGIVVLTTGYQAIKSALANPVKSLRSE